MNKIGWLALLVSVGAQAQNVSFTPLPRLMFTMVDGVPTPASGSGAVLPFLPDPFLCYGLNTSGQPAPCVFSGGGGGDGISGLTAGFIPLAGSATTLTANSHLDDGVTTAGTITSSEPLALSGTANGSITQTFTGTAAAAPGTNQFQISPAISITTPWSLSPAAAPSTGVMVGTNTAGVVQQSFIALAGTGAGVTTGPTTATSGDLAFFNGTTGQISDGAIAGANVVTLTGTQTLSNKTLTAPVIGAATGSSLTLTGNISTSGGSVVANNIGFGETAVTSTTTAINVGSQVNTITLAGNYSFTMLGNATVSGKQVCLIFVQPASGGPFTVTAPSNVKGFFLGSSGAIGTTASLHNEQCFVYSNSIIAWTPTSGGVINF